MIALLSPAIAAILVSGAVAAPAQQAVASPTPVKTAFASSSYCSAKKGNWKSASAVKTWTNRCKVPSRSQFYCLSQLWKHESGWRYKARNPYSGAYGIPQSLPASKMRSAGADWRTNPRTQVKWGLKYIKGRYGTPCGAWGHFTRRNWY
jgi:hypothetical protein